MATRPYTVSIPVTSPGANVPNALIVTWTGLLNNDDGQPFVCPNKADKSVQVSGTFGAGGNMRFEGTNSQAYSPDGTALAPSYANLRDVGGTTINLTAADIRQVLENPNAVRPRITAGDVTTSLTVSMVISAASRQL